MGNIIKMDLAVKLVAEELMEKAKELAGKNQELAKLITHKQEINSRLNADKKKLEGVIEELSDTLTTGEEIRSVDCEVTFDTDQGRKFVHRLDTHERVSSCYLSNADLQIEMKFYGEDGEEDPEEGEEGDNEIEVTDQLVSDDDLSNSNEEERQNDGNSEGEAGSKKEEDAKNKSAKKPRKFKVKNRRRKG